MNAIELTSVTKRYRVGVGRARVREMIPPPVDLALQRAFPRWWWRDTFDALAGINLNVPAGSAIGIVGHNGAGKTTLLKVIAGVTAPSSGSISTRGRLAALLDVLVGFHPELTGRENAYLLGSMLGIGRRTMAPKLDDAIKFAELDDEMMDTPVKRYSAGMTSRLAFGVITAVDPEVLLVDEVLSVGDADFQRKCIDWLDEFRATGGTLAFVSHNLAIVRSMSERAIWLDHGRVVEDGPTSEVLAMYARASEQRRRSDNRGHRLGDVTKQMRSRGLDRWGAGAARVDQVRVNESTPARDKVEVAITYEPSTLGAATFCVGLLDEAEREIGVAASPLTQLSSDGGVVRCSFARLPLRPGIYFPVVAILSRDGRIQDRWRLDKPIVVEANGRRPVPDGFGSVELPCDWSG
jgi:ABC-type polysaccharide/polyol phosphate transport system ATPase subunit